MDDEKSFSGQRIVVTRSSRQAEKLCQKLAAMGAQPIPFPAIEFEPVRVPELDRALEHIDRYDWLIFTSGNAVHFFMERLASWGHPVDLNGPGRPRVSAIGSATTDKLEQAGVKVDVVPDEFTGVELVEALGPLAARRVLLPRASKGRPEIVAALVRKGAVVDDIPLYDTVRASPTPAALKALQDGFDVVTFTSPSSVRNFLKILVDVWPAGREHVDRELIACIGPSTAAEADFLGLTVGVMPEHYTVDELIAAIATHFRPSPSENERTGEKASC